MSAGVIINKAGVVDICLPRMCLLIGRFVAPPSVRVRAPPSFAIRQRQQSEDAHPSAKHTRKQKTLTSNIYEATRRSYSKTENRVSGFLRVSPFISGPGYFVKFSLGTSALVIKGTLSRKLRGEGVEGGKVKKGIT